MYTVRVEAGFSAAHFLTEYHGKCERMHGHNYLVRAYARGGELDAAGMLVDFGVLKRHLRAVAESLDHRNLNEVPEFANSPSAERIARYVFESMMLADPSLPLSAVEVFETDTSVARYEP
ncbi:MAG TPA: 6-carboxytetrahydropterin synthase QueD [Spirochaetales bacterium]|nr:6-carboxytetrahydropterin synthase QueD [Spirochaetales bacterium]MBP7264676.1 6-carboxytetrahydropterin synthase QueD [Spirochaetia bacterium]HPE36002.1 6-carboxytetrahydropterin synthase QueD [Spirochaetales bacterium]